MIKVIAKLLGGALLTAGAPLVAQTTDSSYLGAFEQLRTSNPDHYQKLRQIAAGLAEKPSRVESDWLAQAFGATDGDVGRPSLVFGDLPKQSLQFKLEEARYRLEVIRTDLNVAIERPQQSLVQ